MILELEKLQQDSPQVSEVSPTMQEVNAGDEWGEEESDDDDEVLRRTSFRS